MLVKVYRHGPTRQRLLKGYIVAAEKSEPVLQEIRQRWPHGSSVSLVLSPKQPSCVWLDTGVVWLHTPRARAEVFGQLAEAVSNLGSQVAARGGHLLPNAVRTSETERWHDSVCGDEHVLETIDNVEREICCNFIRGHTPTLIALTGRSGLTEHAIERLASCHLSTSVRHYAARYLASVSPLHLGRVAQELRREEGVSRIDLLDVSPEGKLADSAVGVQLRCIDGQTLLSTARAHAILCQAMMIRSRRMARAGRRVGAIRQNLIERNRAHAIAEGLSARFERDVYRKAGGDNRGHDNSPPTFSSASDFVMDMLMDFQEEFGILEVEYDEVAPLVLGLSLRRMGYAGIRNENDLLRVLRSGSTRRASGVIQLVEALVRDQRGGDLSPISQLNEKSFSEPAKEVRSWWDFLLHSEPIKIRRTRVTAANEHASDSSGARQSKGHDQERKRSSPGVSSETTSFQKAAEQLFKDVQNLEKEPSIEGRLTCIERFQRDGSANDLGKALASLGRERARIVRDRLRPPRESQYRILLGNVQWGSQFVERAVADARKSGLAMIYCEVDEREMEDVLRAFVALEEQRPPDLNLYRLQLAKYSVGEKNWARLDTLIVRGKESPS
jgi:hypothetical protein